MTASSATIRPTNHDELETLREIEISAGERFREIGMGDIADHDPPPVTTLAAYVDDGRSWVATDGDAPVGYVIVDFVDDCAHVEQISVHPDAQGQGLGRALIEHVANWARDRGLAGLTLTTFRDVEWNAPLYRRLGFRDLAESELGPGLRALRDEEATHGLDPTTRVCMRRYLR